MLTSYIAICFHTFVIIPITFLEELLSPLEGDDYESGPFIVTIPSGETNVPFNISIIDDNIFEANESFNLTINSSSIHSSSLIYEECKLTVTIVDNEGEVIIYIIINTSMKMPIYYIILEITVRFDNITYTVNEDDGIVQLLLVLSNPSSSDETVQIINTEIMEDGMYSKLYFYIHTL